MTRATNANRIVNGRRYRMWLDKDDPSKAPHASIDVEIIGWQKSGNPGVNVTPPMIMNGMDRDYIIQVRDLASGSILTITDAPNNGGAVWYQNQRATFHEIV